jgi:hypothetical protein
VTTFAIEELVDDLDRRLTTLTAEHAHRATFLATYRRTTQAVGMAVKRGFFEDDRWVVRWTAVLGRYFTDAHDADLAHEPVPRMDEILAGRVAAEDSEIGAPRRILDRALTPANRLASRASWRSPAPECGRPSSPCTRPGWAGRSCSGSGWPSWRCWRPPRWPTCSAPG